MLVCLLPSVLTFSGLYLSVSHGKLPFVFLAKYNLDVRTERFFRLPHEQRESIGRGLPDVHTYAQRRGIVSRLPRTSYYVDGIVPSSPPHSASGAQITVVVTRTLISISPAPPPSSSLLPLAQSFPLRSTMYLLTFDGALYCMS